MGLVGAKISAVIWKIFGGENPPNKDALVIIKHGFANGLFKDKDNNLWVNIEGNLEIEGEIKSEISNITEVKIKLTNKDKPANDKERTIEKTAAPNTQNYSIKDLYNLKEIKDFLVENKDGYDYEITATNGTETKNATGTITLWVQLKDSNFSKASTRNKISGYFESKHLFYYKLNGKVNNRGIDIHSDDEFRTYIPSANNVTLPNGNKIKVPTLAKDKFQEAFDRIKKVKIQINVSYEEDGVDKVNPISERALSDLISNIDGAWVHRFIGTGRNISVHTYGLAMDINTSSTDYPINQQSSVPKVNKETRKKIDDAVEQLCDGKVSESNDIKTYSFTYKAEEKLDEIPKELVNFFLYHLAIKASDFYWGAYFDATDAMHYSLVEVAEIPESHSGKIP